MPSSSFKLPAHHKLISTESPATPAFRLNVEDFLLYPLNPGWISMSLVASGTFIFARSLSVSTSVLRLVSALTLASVAPLHELHRHRKSADNRHISRQASHGP